MSRNVIYINLNECFSNLAQWDYLLEMSSELKLNPWKFSYFNVVTINTWRVGHMGFLLWCTVLLIIISLKEISNLKKNY